MLKKLSLLLSLILTLSLFGCKGESEQTPFCVLEFEYEKGQIVGSATYYNFCDFLTDGGVVFNLYPNKLGGKSGCITPLTALLNEKEIDFNVQGEHEEYLEVLGDFKMGDKLKIEFLTTLTNGEGRLSVGNNVVNLSYFYPHLCMAYEERAVKYPFSPFGDPFFDPVVGYEVRFTLPSVMSVACGLTPIFVDVLGEKTQYGYKIKGAQTVAFCVSDQFMVVSKKWGYKRVNYYYYDDEEPEKRLDGVIFNLDFFEKRVGRYNHENFTIAQTDCLDGGMEYPAFCMVGENANEREYDYCILHEVAHQWFGVGVDFNQYKNGWLDEGLAECLSMLCLKRVDKEQFDERFFYAKGLSDAFDKALSRGVFGYKEGVFRSLNEYQSQYEYVICAYKKPMLAFLRAANEIGEERFFKGLKRVYEKYYGKKAGVDEFCKSFKINSQRVQKCLPKGA